MPARPRARREDRARPDPDWVLAGRAWVGGRLQPVEIGISEEGTIVALGRSVRAGRRVDLGEAVLMPSAVDLHVHFREPGGPEAADSIPTGTRQAVHGGVGTVGDMPNTEPPIRTREEVEAKADRIRGRAACDVVVYALLERPSAVAGLGRAAGAFKLYAGPTTAADAPPPSTAWPGLFEAARRTDLPIAVHAEDPARFPSSAAAPTNLVAWDAARPRMG